MKPMAVGLAIIFVCLAAPVRAQGPRVITFERVRTPEFLSSTPQPQSSIMRARLGISADSTGIKRTHWLEGGLIGGVVMGVVGAGFCGYTSVPCIAVGFAILGGGIGFPVGALIGGMFPKEP